MNGRICGFCVISFNCSINQFLEYCDLTKVIAARLLTNFTFVLQRISKRKFVIIFCSTEVLFSRHSESNRTHIFLEQVVQSLQKISFYEYSRKNSQEGKCSSPRSMFREENVCDEISLIFRNVVGFVGFVCFQQYYSAASVGQTKQHSLRLTNQKK